MGDPFVALYGAHRAHSFECIVSVRVRSTVVCMLCYVCTLYVCMHVHYVGRVGTAGSKYRKRWTGTLLTARALFLPPPLVVMETLQITSVTGDCRFR